MSKRQLFGFPIEDGSKCCHDQFFDEHFFRSNFAQYETLYQKNLFSPSIESKRMNPNILSGEPSALFRLTDGPRWCQIDSCCFQCEMLFHQFQPNT